MNLLWDNDWTARLNIAAACVSFSFICAVVVGLV